MAYSEHSTAAPEGVVVPFPGIAPANYEALRRQTWRSKNLPDNVVCIRQPRQAVRLPDTPERAFIRALGRQLTPKAYTGLVSQLQRQALDGDLSSKAALLMVMGDA